MSDVNDGQIIDQMVKDDIIFTQAQMSDMPELVRLRIAYMRSDYGSLSDAEFLPVL